MSKSIFGPPQRQEPAGPDAVFQAVMVVSAGAETCSKVCFVTGDIDDFVRVRRAGGVSVIWLVGDREWVQAFLERGRIDEFILSVHYSIPGFNEPSIKLNERIEPRHRGD